MHVIPAMAAVTLATGVHGYERVRASAHVGPVRLTGAHTRSSPRPLTLGGVAARVVGAVGAVGDGGASEVAKVARRVG